jgi:hypothetical protein
MFEGGDICRDAAKSNGAEPFPADRPPTGASRHTRRHATTAREGRRSGRNQGRREGKSSPAEFLSRRRRVLETADELL